MLDIHSDSATFWPAPAAPQCVIIGHVTRDIMLGRRRGHVPHHLGGTAAFAARAASALGIASAVVTAAPDDFDLLDAVSDDQTIKLVRVPCVSETTFHLAYTPTGRHLAVKSRACDICLSDVPKELRHAPLSYVAPILGECGADIIDGLNSRCVLASIQGWLRRLGPKGEVLPAIAPILLSPPKGLSAAVFSELDHPDSEVLAQGLAKHGVLVALTRSRQGVSLFLPHKGSSRRIDVPAAQAHEVDPTGAGDVFGLVFGMALAQGDGPVQAAEAAALAAARVVEGEGLGNLATCRNIAGLTANTNRAAKSSQVIAW